MSVWMSVHVACQDYAEWKRAHDGEHALLEEYGWTAEMVFHNGNQVLVLAEFPDADATERLQADPRLREAMRTAGVVGIPDVGGPWTRDT